MTLRNMFGDIALDATMQDILTELQRNGRLDADNSTFDALGSGATFTGAWKESTGLGAISFFAFSDQPYAELRLEWSDDGVTKATGLLAESDFLLSEDETGGFYVYYPDPQTYLLRDYYRIVAVNDTTAQAVNEVYTWTFPVGANPFAFLDIDGVPSTLQKALLTKPVNPALDIVTFTDADHGTIPSGSAVTIDPVLNAEANVLDSGWIETATFAGKNIVNALGDTSVKVFLMNASDDQGANIFGNVTPTLTTSASFPAQLSALFADKFFRIVVCNESGSDLTDYSIRCEAAPESTDGIATGIDQPIFGFFPAKVGRSVGVGRLPSGDYINVPAGGVSTDQSTQDNLDPAETFIGAYSDARGYSSALVFVIADQPLDVNIQWSSDGATPRAGVISSAAVDVQVIEDGFGPGADVYVYLDVLTTMVDNYYRIEIENTGASTTTVMESDVWLYTTPYTGSFGGLTDNLTSLSTALLARSVQAGTTPDGDFVNQRAGGQAAALSTSTELVADGVWQSDIVDAQGFITLGMTVRADVDSVTNGLLIEFFADELGTDSLRQVPLTYDSATDASTGQTFLIPVQGPYVRITYTNGPTGQNDFNLSTQLETASANATVQPLNNPINGRLLAGLVKAALSLPDDAGDYQPITSSDDGGLRVSVKEHEADTPIKALSEWSASRFNVATGSIVRIASNRAGRKSVAVKHNGSVGVLNIGPTADDVSTGDSYPMDAKESVVLELDEGTEVWASVSGLTGLTGTDERLGGATANNNGVTTPANLLAANDQRAIFDAISESVDVQGFTPEGVYTSIGDVKLRLEGRKASSPTTETVAFVDAVSATQSGGTAVTSPTVTAMTDGCYVAYVHEGIDSTSSVGSVTGLGLTWSLVAAADSDDKVRTSVFVATGTPASDGTVTANLAAAADLRATIHVLRFSGVDQASPVQASDPESASSTTLSSGAVAGTATTGLFVAGAATEDRAFTLSAPPTNRSSLDNNKLRTEVYTGTASASNTAAGSFDAGGAKDWALVALTLLPAAARNPVIEVATDVNGSAGSTLVATLNQTSDFVVELDITGDRTWEPDDITDLVLTLTATDVGAVPAQVDYVSLVVTEVSEGGAVQVAVLNIGDG